MSAGYLKKFKDAVSGKNFAQKYLVALFAECDKDHDGFLDPEEGLPRAIQLLGAPRGSAYYMKALAKAMGGNESGVRLASWLAYFSPDMSATRLKIVQQCFKTLSPGGGDIPLADIRARLGGGKFAIIGGRRVLMDEVIDDLATLFDMDRDGVIQFADFLNYYKVLSGEFKTDQEFREVVQAGWCWGPTS